MSDSEYSSSIMTRNQKKEMEEKRNKFAFQSLETSIKKSVLSQTIQKMERDKKVDIEKYLKKMKKEIENKDTDFEIEYKGFDSKKKDEILQLFINSVDLLSAYIDSLLKTITDEKKEDKHFDIMNYLKSQEKSLNKKNKKAMSQLKDVEDKLKENEKKKKLKSKIIDNSSDEEEIYNKKVKITNKDKQDIRDFGTYVLGLKGHKLEEFLFERIKSVKQNEKEESEEDSDYDTEDSDYDSECSDYDSQDEDIERDDEQMFELLGDKWEPKDLEYYKLRKYHSNEKKKDIKYFRNLDEDEKDKTIHLIETINKMNEEHKPLLFKIIDSNMTIANKAIVVKKLESLGDEEMGENNKLKTWVEGLLSVPFGIYKKEKINQMKSSKKDIKKYIKKCSNTLDKAVYGHTDAKNHILQILAQNITNPKSKGNIFGIRGPHGNGKTSLVKKGISKAINRPFAFISLGGATDASYLEGHSFTYEGSIWGEIVSVLIKSKCMNPVIYFDELDKVSDTPRGEEIINILMHITDQSQNSHFNDKYFQGIDFDLSQCAFIFSYNDIHKINPILRDRIVNINTNGFKTKDKLNIANNYLLPSIMEDMGIDKDNIQIDEDILEMIIEDYTEEGGVRKFKECIYEIVRDINLREIKGDNILNNEIKYPFKITKDMIKEDIFYKKYQFKKQIIHNKPRVGMVNGLYASSNDTGGITVVEALNIPTSEKLGLELTGQQGDIMRESMKVAKSVSWSILPNKIKEELHAKWKNGNEGIHIHCPEGATPKDGPSAGGAITTAIVSLLSGIPVKNNIAMTGEINLSGNITEIGGLDSKLMGAKKAGVRLALIPQDNEGDFNKIVKEYPDLIEKDKFEVKIVSNIYEILKIALVNEIQFNDEPLIKTKKNKKNK